jgi:hypothetical protein
MLTDVSEVRTASIIRAPCWISVFIQIYKKINMCCRRNNIIADKVLSGVINKLADLDGRGSVPSRGGICLLTTSTGWPTQVPYPVGTGDMFLTLVFNQEASSKMQ